MTGGDVAGLVARAGTNEASFTDPGFPSRPLSLFSARPARFTARTPVLFVHHGRGRNGGDYRDYLAGLVDEHDMLVIAPQFSDEHFPGQAWYNGGNLLRPDGGVNPPPARSYALVERLFSALVAAGITSRRGYGLFGHSAGSQFVHRMVLLGHRGRVVAAVAANAGTYMMPDLDVDFPHGLRGTGLGEEDLRRLLGVRLTVMAGTADNNPDEPHFPRDPGSMRQGGTRYARAHRFIAEGRAAAARLGTFCAWTIIDVPDVAHDGLRMAVAAAPILSAALHAAEQEPAA